MTLAVLAVLIIFATAEPSDGTNLSQWLSTLISTKLIALLAGVALWAIVRFWVITPSDEKYFGIEMEEDDEEDYWV